jgi:hypothetical protein
MNLNARITKETKIVLSCKRGCLRNSRRNETPMLLSPDKIERDRDRANFYQLVK